MTSTDPLAFAGIFEAVRCVDEFNKRKRALYREFEIDGEIEERELNPRLLLVFNSLSDYCSRPHL